MAIRMTGMMLTLVLFVLSAHTHADEQAAIDQISKSGGTVRVIARDSKEKEATFHLSDQDINDMSLEPLKEISDLVWLNLRGTKVTDAGLAHLANLKSLKRLHLEKTQVTDEGLKHLGRSREP